MNYLISEGNFNPKTVEIVQKNKIRSESYLQRLEYLKYFYDKSHYAKIKNIIRKINDFSKKYLEQNQSASIIKKDFSTEEKKLKQNNEFIKESVEYYLNGNKIIYQDIKKISEEFNTELRVMILSLYDLEESSILIIEDICKKINFQENISISKMLKVIG